MKLDITDLKVETMDTSAAAIGADTLACTVKCDDTQQRTCGYTDCTCLIDC